MSMLRNRFELSFPIAALSAAVLAALLTGCAAGPDYQRPEVELPAQWPAATGGQAAEQAAQAAAAAPWWTLYRDETLDALVQEALQTNADLVVATTRIDEARAALRLADADKLPSLDASFARARTRVSHETTVLPPGSPDTFNSYQAQLTVAYEVDLWGRVRRASEAARAELQASVAARETVRNALAAQVAQSYFGLIALDAQMGAVRRTLDARRSALDLQRRRTEAGLQSDFEYRQQEAELAALQVQWPALERQRTQLQNALAVLVGRSPRALMEEGIVRGTATTPVEPVVPAGLPSELLLSRPDLREAEQRLIAANARIGAARAAYFPAIGLTGSFGSESVTLSNLFTGPARTFLFAAQIAQPIFDAGRTGARVDAATAGQQRAVAQYRQAIANAFREVSDALAAQRAARDTLEAERIRTGALQKTLGLARLRFDNGVASQLEVLDAERALLAAEFNRIDAERQQRAAIADLFKALGTGWPAG
jgi:multidrug efflux system outer membrane protein